MMAKRYFDGRWHYRPVFDEWGYYEPGERDPAVQSEPDMAIRGDVVRQLIQRLDEEGWIVPRLDERLRDEDLKITHRLLDVVDALTGKSR